MSYQTMTIGASPCEESCAQVGHPGYEARSRRECLVFRRMLERLFPLADDVPARFAVISSPHEFGTYREVCVRYEDSDARACDHAYAVEANTPAQCAYSTRWRTRFHADGGQCSSVMADSVPR